MWFYPLYACVVIFLFFVWVDDFLMTNCFSLSVSSNNIAAKGIIALSKAVKSSSVSVLELWNNPGICGPHLDHDACAVWFYVVTKDLMNTSNSFSDINTLNLHWVSTFIRLILVFGTKKKVGKRVTKFLVGRPCRDFVLDTRIVPSVILSFLVLHWQILI